MKKSLMLIPSLVTLSATPIMSLTGCVVDAGGGDKPEPTPPEPVEDWVTWDFIEQGLFEKEIEKAPSSTESTPEACNAAYFDWLAKDKNNIIYDYLLSISRSWIPDYTECWVSIKINNIDMENHLISFNFKSNKTFEYETSNVEHKEEMWFDVECVNIELLPVCYDDITTLEQYWLIGSVVSQSGPAVDIWKDFCLPLLLNPYQWCAKGSYCHKIDGEIMAEITNANYDVNDAQQAYTDHDSPAAQLVINMATLYDVLSCRSTFLSEVPQPSQILTRHNF